MRKAWLAVAALAIMAGPAAATTLLPLDVQGLTRDSTSVVVGRVVAATVLDSQPGVPLTQLTVDIEETLKGGLSGTVVVNNPGFQGAPDLRASDEAVLFIYTRDGTHVLTGLQQGSFKIVSDGRGGKQLERGIPSKDKSTAGSRSVDALITEILSAE
ncbi:MAG: hypothetical protein KC466_07775 [Myxococcales bacterium]|nr:hypothetical protein [Myxococcales bacterium]